MDDRAVYGRWRRFELALVIATAALALVLMLGFLVAVAIVGL